MTVDLAIRLANLVIATTGLLIVVLKGLPAILSLRDTLRDTSIGLKALRTDVDGVVREVHQHRDWLIGMGADRRQNHVRGPLVDGD